MGRAHVLDTFHLRPSERLAHTEFAHRHLDLIEKVTGLRPEIPQDFLGDNIAYWEAVSRFYQAWELELIFPGPVQHGPLWWRRLGRTTDMGHGSYAPGGSDLRAGGGCPFHSPEEVWAFDAEQEYGLFDETILARYHQKRWAQMQAIFADTLVLGGRYFSVMSGMIEAFGWDMLLEAWAEPERMAAVVDSFARLTMRHMRAWAQTSAPIIGQHDDIVWANGPFLRPEIYRELIFPHYRAFWEVLHEAGKKVLYISDGDYSPFFDDIAEAGADGFFLETCGPLDLLVEKYGATHVIVGSHVDCRTLAGGSWEAVQEQMDRTLAIAKPCPGFIWAVTNQFPYNIPVEMAERYQAYVRENGRRP